MLILKKVMLFILTIGLFVTACSSKNIRDLSKQLQDSNDSNAQLLGNTIAGTQKLSAEDERELGAELAGALIKIHGLHPNDRLQKYVNVLGNHLARNSRYPNLQWRFGVLDTDDINAFSTPAGYILISHGLIKILTDEAELAGILSHEIIHVTERHHLNAIRKSSLAAGVANLGQILAENKKGQDESHAVKLMQLGSEVFARGLDKKDEYAADQKGILLSNRSGYDAYGLVRVLIRLSEINTSENKVSLLFKTHPSCEERLNEIEKNISSKMDVLNTDANFRSEFVAATR